VAVLLAVVPGTAPGAYAETHWKARLLSGDTTAPVFDNATREMPRLLERRGVEVVATSPPIRRRCPRRCISPPTRSESCCLSLED
jgi:hypothetical protein